MFTVNTTYEWRLVGGNTEFEGRLEIRFGNRTWAPMEGYSFGYREAIVACRMFGFSHPLSPVIGKFGSRTSEPFYQAFFHCTGEEQHLLDCRFEFNIADSISDWEPLVNYVGLVCLPGKSYQNRDLLETK